MTQITSMCKVAAGAAAAGLRRSYYVGRRSSARYPERDVLVARLRRPVWLCGNDGLVAAFKEMSMWVD